MCPVCLGGTDHEESLSIWEIGDGVYATCHRAKCGVGTVRIINRDTMEFAIEQAPKRSRDPVTGRVQRSLTQADVDQALPNGGHGLFEGVQKFKCRYPALVGQFVHKYIKAADADGNKVYFPMFDAKGVEHGVIVKQSLPGRPKSLTHKYEGHEDYSGMSWYTNPALRAETDSVFAVEDCVSALAILRHGHQAVSLNGTLLNDARMYELAKYGGRVILCLDADATNKAIALKNKYMGSHDIVVRRLMRDPKDMEVDELRNFLEAALSN